jgi:hypothetical protein
MKETILKIRKKDMGCTLSKMEEDMREHGLMENNMVLVFIEWKTSSSMENGMKARGSSGLMKKSSKRRRTGDRLIYFLKLSRFSHYKAVFSTFHT